MYRDLRLRNILIYIFSSIICILAVIVLLLVNKDISDNIIYFSVLLFFSIIILMIGNHLFIEINNPINIFFIGWLLPLTLSQLHLSRLQQDFSFNTWLLIILSIIVFLVPTIISGLKLNNKYKSLKVSSVAVKINVDNLYKPITAIGMLTILAIAINWILLGGIPLVVGERAVSHVDNTRFITTYVIFFAPYLSGFSIFYLILKGSKYRKLIWLFAILPYIYSILHMLRSFMLATLFSQMCFIYLAYRVRGSKISQISKKFFIYGFIGIMSLMISMVLIGNIRLQNMAGNVKLDSHFWSNTLGFYIDNESLAWFYSYYVMGINNLDFFINNYSGPYLYGYNVLLPIIGPLQIKNFWYIDPDYVNAIIPRLWGNAVGTYLREIYLDGGLIYTLIVVFIISVFINYIYIKSVNNGINLCWSAAYIVASYGVFYMFFNSGALLSPNVVLFVLISYFIAKKYIVVETG